jgi:Ca2+-binding EF-hand superfamily protein
MSRQNARERDPILRVKEVLERGFADLYDAFADMDTDEDGKVSLHDFQQSIKNLEGGDAFTSDQIDTVFNKCGVDQDGLLAFKGFHDFFMGKDKGLATDTSGISSSVIPRSFEEVGALGRACCCSCVCAILPPARAARAAAAAAAADAAAAAVLPLPLPLLLCANAGCVPTGARRPVSLRGVVFLQVLMECRDAENKQKFITVPSTMQWSELRDKLKHKYGRAVNFMYEADGHTYTVRDERDFKLCWDSVEEAFVKSNPVTPSAHLQAFIMDIDPTKLTSSDRAGGLRTGRRSHLAPKKVTLGGVHDDGAAGRDGGERRRLAQEDFDKKHQFIDEMMRKTGVSDVEPSNMRKKWDRLIKECVALDQRREKAVKTDDFKKALTKLDQNMTADQMAWYIKDAEKNKCKNSAGDIMYEKYCTLKKTGMVVKEGEGLLDDEINKYSSLICKGLQDRYKTLQNAFKRIDEDKDGIISKQDFRQVLETKLKIILQRQYFDAIFTNADYKQDGYLDYEEFLDFFRKVPPSLATASATENIDAMSMPDLCKLLLRTFGGTQDVFQELDVEGDGYIDTQKLMSGFHKAGIKIGLMKVRDLVAEITGGQTDGKIDYLKLLKFASTVSQSDLHGSGVDEVGKEEARVRDKIREHYPDAKQAFHAFNTNKDGRLSEKEFFKGVDSVFSDPAEKPTMAIKNRLMNRADLDGDGFLAYHEFLARYGVKPVMRQAMSLERKVSAALQKLFPESLHKAFEEMDQNKDRYLDKEDLQTGIKKVLKITNFEKAEMDAFLDKLKLDENEKGLDFSAFLVRFGLDYRMDGRWEFRKEEKKKDTKESEEVKLFRRSMLASKWFGRGGIKAVMLRYSVLGSMYGKWDTLKQKCSQHTDQQGQGTIKRSTFQDLMKGSTGVEPNITDIQWDLFSTEFLEKHENKEKPAEGGFKFKENEVLYAKLCDHLRDNKRSLAQLMIKDFSSALRDGLKMSGLSSEDIQLLSGKSTGKSWWNKKINSVDVDKFETEFVLKEFEPELTLFRVLLVKNVWLDINRVLDSLNIAPHSSRSMISKADFIGAFERLEALKIVKKEEKDAILQKVAKDALYETEGPSVGQVEMRARRPLPRTLPCSLACSACSVETHALGCLAARLHEKLSHALHPERNHAAQRGVPALGGQRGEVHTFRAQRQDRAELPTVQGALQPVFFCARADVDADRNAHRRNGQGRRRSHFAGRVQEAVRARRGVHHGRGAPELGQAPKDVLRCPEGQ